jgi:DNA N-6-adenine-methyltransferase (Dam)
MNELAVVHRYADGVMRSRYETARFALAEACRVDEVKDIVDAAAAMQEYFRRAKDTQMLENATELRLEAERKGGALLAKMKESGERRGDGRPWDNGSDERPLKLADLKITKTQASKWQQLAALPDEKFEIRVEHAKARVKGMTTSAPNYFKAEYTGENEWFTPAKYVELARAAMGGIDLDPASHAIAQETVRAGKFFVAADNGLDRPWFGKVWLNPPYCRELLSPFVDKLVEEWTSGRVSQAILLTHDSTDTEWFHTAARACRTFCFPSSRVRFRSPAGDECSPREGEAFFYFGTDDRAFRRVFGAIGIVAALCERDGGGSDMSKNKEPVDRFFKMFHYVMESEAWKALSLPARAVYFQICLRYNGSNNGRLAMSVRAAAKECGINVNTVMRAFRELVEFGFVEETRHGGLCRKTRLASEWRLTAYYCDLTARPKTCLFMQRGEVARAYRQPRSRLQTGARLSERSSVSVVKELTDCLKGGAREGGGVLNEHTAEADFGGFGASTVLNE